MLSIGRARVEKHTNEKEREGERGCYRLFLTRPGERIFIRKFKALGTSTLREKGKTRGKESVGGGGGDRPGETILAVDIGVRMAGRSVDCVQRRDGGRRVDGNAVTLDGRRLR